MYKDWLMCIYGVEFALSCEGGARSLSVLDNDVGSGSISPLIVSGGKNGDVGIHDFRYIATGKAKRHRYADNGEQSTPKSLNSDKDKNVNGMLWYIPKAHAGSITKIAGIPNTSLFLTGSKDGDVKLWDVKSTQLVCQWSKLHEKHTFLQPSSRGFGGVVRVMIRICIKVDYIMFSPEPPFFQLRTVTKPFVLGRCIHHTIRDPSGCENHSCFRAGSCGDCQTSHISLIRGPLAI